MKKSFSKKSLAFLLALAVVLSSMMTGIAVIANAEENELDIWDGNIATEYAGGTGTATDPILISTPEQFAKLVHDGNTYNLRYKLTNDIYLNDVTNENWKDNSPRQWYTFSDTNVKFSGVLDGDGHTIYGYYFNGNVGTQVGLFPRILDCGVGTTISNLTIAEAYLNNAGDYAGIISGFAHANGGSYIFSNCIVEDSVYVSGKTYVGSFVGYIQSTVTVSGCASYATVASGANKGMFGYQGAGTMTFNDSFAVGTGLVGTKKATVNTYRSYENVVASQIIGEAAKTTMPNLNWKAVWKTTEGYPALRDSVNGTKGEAWTGITAQKYAGGNGTVDNPYMIETAEQLYKMVTSGVATKNSYFKLAADIYINDVSADNWQADALPWDAYNYRFQGHFDGDGYTIYGAYYNGDASSVSLFGQVEGEANVSFKNFTLSDCEFTSSGIATSALVGYFRSGAVAKFQNIYITDSVKITSTSTSDSAGSAAFVSWGTGTISIENCASLATISSNGTIGALTGYVWGTTLTVSNTFASAALKFAGESKTTLVATDCYGVGTGIEEAGVERLESAELMKGAAAKTNMPNLNWKGTWVVSDSYPVFGENPDGIKGEVWTGGTALNYAGGTGKENDPFIIETAEQLAKMIKDGSGYYKLVADIYLNDVSNPDWVNNEPNSWYDRADINNTAFTGSLDGDGYTIYGLYYNGSNIVALFPQASNTTITNLKISDADITSTSHVAAIVSFGQNKITITNCVVDNTVKLTSNGTSSNAVAGFVAYGYPVIHIERSAVWATIAGTSKRGAFIGECWEGAATNRKIIDSISGVDAPMTAHNNNAIYAVNCYTIGTENMVYENSTLTKLDSIDMMLGAAAKENMPLLSWNDQWFVTDGYPTVFGTPVACDHAYDNACDAYCNVCGAKRTVGDHAYDNTCDTDCNECGAVREIEHTYANVCDANCDICGNIREVEGHIDEDANGVCDKCEASLETTCTHEKTTTTTVDATCTVDGSVTVTCDACGETISTEVIEAKGHTISDWIVETPAKPGIAGLKYKACSVCGAERVEEAIEAVKLIGIGGLTLTLESNIAINYRINSNYFSTYGYDEIYLVVDFNGKKTTIRDYVMDGDRLVFTFSEVSANMMSDKVLATAYGVYDGEVYECRNLEYSVVKYAKDQIAGFSGELLTLLVDLLNYGTVAQQYTGNNLENLANAWLSAEQIAAGTQTDRTPVSITAAKYEAIDSPIAKWRGATLVLEAAVTVRYKILIEEDITGMTAVFECDGDTYTVDSSEFEPAGDNHYYIYISKLNAAQMSSPLYGYIVKDGAHISNTIRYSIESYVADSYTDTSVPYLNELIKAMLKYGDSAYNYIH